MGAYTHFYLLTFAKSSHGWQVERQQFLIRLKLRRSKVKTSVTLVVLIIKQQLTHKCAEYVHAFVELNKTIITDSLQ